MDKNGGMRAFWPQMLQRPRSHEVEDLSRNQLRDAFNGVGWREFTEPVIVARWDSKAGRIYWNCVQTYFSTEEGKTALAAATEMLRILVNLPLDATGLLWVRSIRKSRFERSQDERQGVQALIDLLKEHLKLQIE